MAATDPLDGPPGSDAGLRARLAAALGRPAGASSDYDLNPDVILPAGRILRDAAVLVAILPGAQGGPRLILTKRSSALRNHPGQVALPGGKIDPADAHPEAAARQQGHDRAGAGGRQPGGRDAGRRGLGAGSGAAAHGAIRPARPRSIRAVAPQM